MQLNHSESIELRLWRREADLYRRALKEVLKQRLVVTSVASALGLETARLPEDVRLVVFNLMREIELQAERAG